MTLTNLLGTAWLPSGRSTLSAPVSSALARNWRIVREERNDPH
jgi:hypothetical protein